VDQESEGGMAVGTAGGCGSLEQEREREREREREHISLIIFDISSGPPKINNPYFQWLGLVQ
jgi:hypothetical protein